MALSLIMTQSAAYLWPECIIQGSHIISFIDCNLRWFSNGRHLYFVNISFANSLVTWTLHSQVATHLARLRQHGCKHTMHVIIICQGRPILVIEVWTTCSDADNTNQSIYEPNSYQSPHQAFQNIGNNTLKQEHSVFLQLSYRWD